MALCLAPPSRCRVLGCRLPLVPALQEKGSWPAAPLAPRVPIGSSRGQAQWAAQAAIVNHTACRCLPTWPALRLGQSLWWELLAALIGPLSKEAAGPASHLSLLWLQLYPLEEDGVLPGLAGSAGQKFTLVLQMEKEKRLGRLGSCPRLQQGQARLPGETTRKPSDTALFLSLLATEMSSHRKRDRLSAPVAARAMPSTRHRTLALAFMKMCPCENCHTHPRDLVKPTKQKEHGQQK